MTLDNCEPQPDGTYKLTWLIGTKKIEPVKYWLEQKITKRLFWFSKKEYYVVSQFGKLGPFDLEQANEYLSVARNV